MKRNIFPLVLLLLFTQCKKNKDDNKVPAIDKGMFAWFKFDNDFMDYTGNDPAPTHIGTFEPAYDRNSNGNNAMNFKQGLMIFKTDSVLADNLTVSFWMKPEDLTHTCWTMISKEFAFGFYQNKYKLIWMIYTGSEQTEISGVIKSGWNHVAGVANGKETKIYINGVLAESQPHPGKTFGTKSIWVGNYNGIFWPGVLDDLRFYNRALSQEEITQLANL